MSRVRECRIGDMRWLKRTAQKFNTMYYDIPLNPLKLEGYLLNAITHDHWYALRTDGGAIVGCFFEDPLRDWTVLAEMGWFAEDHDGLRLLHAFEDIGRELGANEVRMGSLRVNERVSAVLGRRGYTHIETSHRLLL